MTRWTIPGFDVLAHPAAPLSVDVRAGDLLVRSAPSQGVHYSAIVVSTRPEEKWELQSRGVPIEIAGAGMYVEVAEAPVGGGAPRSVGRRLTDAWGRLPRGQMLLRTSGTRHEEILAATEQVEDKPAQKPTPSTNLPTLTVMTWNIRLGIESSLKAVGDAVLAAGVPDVLALQEIGVEWNMGEKVDQPRVLAKQIGLPHHLFVGALTDKAGGRFGIALLCRWSFTSADVTLLPRDTDEQRVLLRARIAVPGPGLNGTKPASPVSVLNTHLSQKPTKERLKQAAVVGAAAAAAAAEGPVLLLGDLQRRTQLPDGQNRWRHAGGLLRGRRQGTRGDVQRQGPEAAHRLCLLRRRSRAHRPGGGGAQGPRQRSLPAQRGRRAARSDSPTDWKAVRRKP